MTPGVATRSGPAHAKRNPEPAGGSAPYRHTTKSGGRAGSPKISRGMRPNGAFPVSVRLPLPGNRTAVETVDPSNARRVPTRSSDPPARRPERSPTDPRSRKNRRGAPHGSTNRSHRIFRPPASGRHANIRECDDTFAPPTNGGFAGQRNAAKKPVTAIRQEITTTEYRNGGTHRHRRENRRRTTPRRNLVSGPSVPERGTTVPVPNTSENGGT